MLFRFVGLMEAAYSTANMFILGVTLFDITLTEFLASSPNNFPLVASEKKKMIIFQTVQNKEYPEIAFRFVVFTLGELLHILFHNLLSQRVLDHSLIVYRSW